MSVPSSTSVAPAQPPVARALWIVDRSDALDGKSGHRYRCFDDRGGRLAKAMLFRSSKPGIVSLSGDLTNPDFTLRLRKSFPISGKIDILPSGSTEPIAIATRNRKLLTRDGELILRLSDARAFKEHLGEFVVDGIASIFFGDGGDSANQGNRYLLTNAEGHSVGGLTRQTLPFFPEPPRRTKPTAFGKLAKRVLPQKLGSALFDVTPPVGWRLELFAGNDFPEDSILFSYVFMTLEIRRWAS